MKFFPYCDPSLKLNWKALKEAQVVVFTCKRTKTVHLELVNNTAYALYIAFLHFASFHGCLRICWLACETNFVYVEGYLDEIIPSWNIPKIQGIPCEEVSCDFK